MLLAAFFSYHRFYNKEPMTAADKTTKFILVLEKIYIIDFKTDYILNENELNLILKNTR